MQIVTKWRSGNGSNRCKKSAEVRTKCGMEFRTLGRTRLEIFENRAGNNDIRDQADELTALQMVERSLYEGINFSETASVFN